MEEKTLRPAEEQLIRTGVMRVGAAVANPQTSEHQQLIEQGKNSPETGETPPEELAQTVLREEQENQRQSNVMDVTVESETGRPKRQCRQNINYGDNDLDVILEQHLMDNGRGRKRKDLYENEASDGAKKKRGRQAK